jgi:hypothetical protein
MKRILSAVAAGLFVGGGVMAAVVMPSSATIRAGGTAMTPGETVKLASNITLADGAFPIFGPLNTKLCPGLEIYLDAAGLLDHIFVFPIEDTLPGQVNEINAAFTAGGDGDSFEEVPPVPSLEVQVHNETGAPVTMSNLYVYCKPSGG